ncbi:PREDICTED: SCY1-like protein 2 [Dufourea novaeangliae]|uniref:SCY1-like protein 2 n=1 Tax=Dufourea novaeangliae TaxID=178035 RepID=A0A154PDM1_DUFNO|nr:PREDICTED: SCY1-like protein 2 [Dufourea novaeangliae]KZC09290.1 SCY1-like protein 2 [Dufourea novaeangliae]
MDVLTKLRNTVSNTISNTVQNTAYGLSQLSNVLPGNPVTREFEVSAHIASAGPALLWKVYNGYKKSTKQEAAIFVLEKRVLDKFSKNDREIILETLKRGVTQLTKLRHPQILTVQHPLEESRDSLAFATEPVLASLANILGNHDNISQPLPLTLKDYKLHDVEIKYGLLQLGEGLAFLHGDVKLLHRNLCPESIVINSQGAWKIFGFDFCALNLTVEGKQPLWSYVEYDMSLSAVAQPNLNYQAPECILASSVTTASDIFSLGMLTYILHSSMNIPLHECNNDFLRCKKFLENFTGSIVTSKLLPVPESLRDTVKLMLNHNPELRPDAHQFVKIEYFTDIGVKTLNYLDKIFQWDNLQKSQFYKGLPQLLKQLPHRVILHRVIPALYKELINPPMIPFILPSILYAMETSSVEEFREYMLPHMKPVLTLDDPPQISLVLMQHVDLLLKLCTTEVIKTDIVPMLLRALESEWEQLQELCLSALPNIVAMIEGPVIKNAILPRMKKICLHGKGGSTKSLGVKVNCLLCLARMLPNFDRWLVLDQVLPFLQEIPHSGEPAILMAIIGIYRILLNHSKLGASKEILATKILPFLLPLCIEQNFSTSQYEILSSLVVEMINRVTTEHKEALKQLDAMRRETQKLDQELSQTSNVYKNINSTTDTVNTIPPIPAPNTNTNLKSLQIENGLTMEDKFRLIQQQEVHQRLQSQPPLTPKTIQQQPKKPQIKDLTDTLLQSNLDQLNLSISSPKPDYSYMSSNSNSHQHFSSQGMNVNLNRNTNTWVSNQMTWNTTVPQNTINYPINQANFMTSQLEFNSNVNSNPNQKVENLPSQDIMDLLS